MVDFEAGLVKGSFIQDPARASRSIARTAEPLLSRNQQLLLGGYVRTRRLRFQEEAGRLLQCLHVTLMESSQLGVLLTEAENFEFEVGGSARHLFQKDSHVGFWSPSFFATDH